MVTNKVKELVITAFFAAITFLGIQAFRIPLPAAIGTPFVHFGHVFVVMGVLLQNGKKGAVSGTLGLIIFDILNGYMQDVPQVFIETVVKCLIIGVIFASLKEKDEREYLWRLGLNYNRMFDMDKIETYFIDIKDSYYLAELISIQDNPNYSGITTKLINSKDKELIQKMLSKEYIEFPDALKTKLEKFIKD